MSSSIEVIPFRRDLLPAAAALFVQAFQELRQLVPALPDRMADPAIVVAQLEAMMKVCPGVMAVERGEVVGYLGWWVVDHFRGTARRGAYCPEWAHAARDDQKQAIYQALYRAAATQWAEAGCRVHAITLLAHDQAAERAWFWQGFGLTVVDAVRPLQPLGIVHHPGLTVRPATPTDIAQLVTLDAEHCSHYAQPPIFMAPRTGRDPTEWDRFLNYPKNSVWLAFADEQPAGFMGFEGGEFDSADLVRSEQAVCITGAYVRPAYRGQGIASVMLDAALQAYAGHGITSCVVNFESFNPEAAAFWPKYFTPVCFSLLRAPEWVAA